MPAITASCSAVLPAPSWRLGSAPWSSSRRAICRCRLAMARCRAVPPKWPAAQSGSALRSSSTAAAASASDSTASARGGWPCRRLTAPMSAPRSSSRRTAAGWLPRAAACSGVPPTRSRAPVADGSATSIRRNSSSPPSPAASPARMRQPLRTSRAAICRAPAAVAASISDEPPSLTCRGSAPRSSSSATTSGRRAPIASRTGVLPCALRASTRPGCLSSSAATCAVRAVAHGCPQAACASLARPWASPSEGPALPAPKGRREQVNRGVVRRARRPGSGHVKVLNISSTRAIDSVLATMVSLSRSRRV